MFGFLADKNASGICINTRVGCVLYRTSVTDEERFLIARF